MRNLFLISSLLVALGGWSNPARAIDEGPFWGGSADPRVRYWPAYRIRERPEGVDCIRWNWQERSYYDYCTGSAPSVRTKAILRIRD
jgi:hypothetical protein